MYSKYKGCLPVSMVTADDVDMIDVAVEENNHDEEMELKEGNGVMDLF